MEQNLEDKMDWDMEIENNFHYFEEGDELKKEEFAN